MLVGKPIPLSLQLTDREGNLFPIYTLFTQDGSVLGTGDLTHVADGFYVSLDEVLFPSGEEHLYLQYRIFDDSGHTQESADYESTLEILTASDSSELYNLILQKINRLEKLAIGSSVYTIDIEELKDLKIELEEYASMNIEIEKEGLVVTEISSEEIVAQWEQPESLYIELETL